RQRDFSLIPEYAVDSHQAAVTDAGHHLFARRPSIHKNARGRVVGEYIAESSRFIVRQGPQGRKGYAPRQAHGPVLTYTVAHNNGYLPATHLDLVVVDITLPDLPHNAAIARHFPARLCLHGVLKREQQWQDDDEGTGN